MFRHIKGIDRFSRNIIIVFFATSLVNVLNLLYQLLIAHTLSAADFAAFNSLLSIYLLISSPLATLAPAIAKYSAQFNARGEIGKVNALISGFLKKVLILAAATFFIFWFSSLFIIDKLSIPSKSCGWLLAILLALSWVMPVFAGGIQGLELFQWLSGVPVVTGILKLLLTFAFLALGFNIAGALGAFLISLLICLFIYYLPLRSFIHSRPKNLALQGKDNQRPLSINHNRPRPLGRGSRRLFSFGPSAVEEGPDYKEILLYLFPVAISTFCFMGLVNFDMVLVKYFFSLQDSGLYAIAQMVGKIFLFLPGAISIVMFPRTSGLNAKNLDTGHTLRRSLLYALSLCATAVLIYNSFPALILKILTGKIYPPSIFLGRLFSISMSFFTLLFILISYFLSIKDLRFIKYLVFFTLLQFCAIILFHQSLIQVQLVLCVNAILLFVIHLFLALKK